MNQHYLRRYFKFIAVFSGSGTVKHHIFPRAEYPAVADLKQYSWNEALLSHRAHFVAHWLLWKAIGKSQTHAFWMMKHKNNEKLNSRVYAQLKEEQSELNRCPERLESVARNISKTRNNEDWKQNNTFVCEVCAKEIVGSGNIKQHKQAHEGKTKLKGTTHNRGAKISKTLKEIGCGCTETTKCSSHSESANQKRSQTLKGVKKPDYRAPEKIRCGCGRDISPSNMKRHKEKYCEQRSSIQTVAD